MCNKLEQIKQYTISHKDKQGDRYIVKKEDLHWLIEQAELVKVWENKSDENKKILDMIHDHIKSMELKYVLR